MLSTVQEYLQCKDWGIYDKEYLQCKVWGDICMIRLDNVQIYVPHHDILLYINISKDSPYFRCQDEEHFYPFEILGFRTLKL